MVLASVYVGGRLVLKNAFNAKKVRTSCLTIIYVVNAEEAVTVDPTHLWITECTVKKPSSRLIVTMSLFAEQRMVENFGRILPSISPIAEYFLIFMHNRKEINQATRNTKA